MEIHDIFESKLNNDDFICPKVDKGEIGSQGIQRAKGETYAKGTDGTFININQIE